jgi:hypothetical protein
LIPFLVSAIVLSPLSLDPIIVYAEIDSPDMEKNFQNCNLKACILNLSFTKKLFQGLGEFQNGSNPFSILS